MARMTRDDIIRMAREAGWTEYSLLHAVELQRLETFAALVAAEKDKEIEQMQVALTEAHAVREICNQRAFRLEAEIDRLREALDNLIAACELPGDHCEVEQALPHAKAALQEKPK